MPNASFEDTFFCPNGVNNFDGLAIWYNPTNATPDYFNICGNANNNGVPQNFVGFQNPQDGNAYVGLATISLEDTTNYKEYFQVKLNETLKKM